VLVFTLSRAEEEELRTPCKVVFFFGPSVSQFLLNIKLISKKSQGRGKFYESFIEQHSSILQKNNAVKTKSKTICF
jgi:hypothetical protein